MTIKVPQNIDMFNINQIVKGTFVILGFRIISGEMYAQLKAREPR